MFTVQTHSVFFNAGDVAIEPIEFQFVIKLSSGASINLKIKK